MTLLGLPSDILKLVLARVEGSPSELASHRLVCVKFAALVPTLPPRRIWPALKAARQLLTDFLDSSSDGDGHWAFVSPRLRRLPKMEEIGERRRVKGNVDDWFGSQQSTDAEWYDLNKMGLMRENCATLFEDFDFAFEEWNSECDDPSCHSVNYCNPVPDGLHNTVASAILCYEPAYGSEVNGTRDECRALLNSVFLLLGETSESRVLPRAYSFGDYWMNLKSGDDGRSHSGAGGSCFFQSRITVCSGCLIVTKDCVIGLMAASED